MATEDLQTIPELQKKVQKYQTRMRDLIEAYQCVIKEKETLEKTVASFSRQKKVGNNAESGSEVDRLHGELESLSISIASLTEERRRMEKSYLDDRRVMRAEYESNLKAVRQELETQNSLTEKLSSKLKVNKITMEKVDENLNEREYQVKSLNDECNRLRLELSAIQHERTLEKNSHEFRVAQLEETIGDISKNIGQMEKQHQSDNETIAKLTDRVQSLLSESRLSIKSRDNQSDTPDILQFQESDKSSATTTIKTIVERISKLHAQLQDMDPHMDIIPILTRDTGTCNVTCDSKLQQLTDELECAQLKLESVLRSKSSSTYPSYQQQELDRLNEELLFAKIKITDLQDELSTMDGVAVQKERALRDAIAKLERSHKQEMSKARQEHNQTVSELQSELTKHRNRTISLLSEKDTEIQTLQRLVQGASAGPLELDSDLTDMAIASKFDSLCPLYQCCETKARMDQELRRLRHQRRQLEASVHKLEADNEYRRSDWTAEVATLRHRLEEMESLSRLGTSINMEYLRNVFLRFLTATDSSCKYLMAKAIGKVLEISGQDLAEVERCLKG